MKNVSEQELQSAVAIPVKMTRAEKLRYLANMIRNYPRQVRMLSNVEYMRPEQLDVAMFYADPDRSSFNMFSLAMADPVLQEQGLKATAENSGHPCGSLRDVMGFFEVTQAQLHPIACDCHGVVSNTEIANHIERLV